jgi:predicted DNA-binding protein
MRWIHIFKSLFEKPRPITYYELNETIARTLEAVEDNPESDDMTERLHKGNVS